MVREILIFHKLSTFRKRDRMLISNILMISNENLNIGKE